MAPPPFKVVGPLPQPLTVEETAATFSLPPAKVEQLMAALRTSLAKVSGSKSARPAKVVKFSKSFGTSKLGKAPKPAKASKPGRRRMRQPAKAARSSR